MRCKRINIDNKRDVYFDTYFLENSNELQPGIKRPTVIVCPGGGYRNLSDREAEPIALKYNSVGFNAVVLHYGVNTNAVMPGPIKDLAQTIVHLKEKSEEWYIDSDNIFVAGFSAGGHLAASLAVFHNDEDVLPEYKNHDIKPKGVILGYPVLDLKSTSRTLDIGIKGHPEYERIKFDMLHPKVSPEDVFIRSEEATIIDFEVAMNAYMFDGYATEEQVQKYSLQNQVDENTSPAFIWHGGMDGLIFPSNSLKFAMSLDANNINYELHIYGTGDHGLSLADEYTSNNPWELVPEVQNWFEMSVKWVKNQIKK